jgi:hypothetical protein
MRPIIKVLIGGLTLEDEHLLLNTLSTLSNLLRHGSAHLPALLDSGALAKMVELFSKAANSNQINYFMTVLKKALKYPAFLRAFSKVKLQSYMQDHIRSGLLSKDKTTVV